MENFRCGRDFAAWLSLVPRQFSSGGKERLGRVSKAGQADIRSLLIIGAITCVSWAGRKPPVHGSWLSRMLAKKPKMLVAITLVNKMARNIWAMLTKQEDYRCRKWGGAPAFCGAGTLWDDRFPEPLSFHFEFECKTRIFRKHRGVCFDLAVEQPLHVRDSKLIIHEQLDGPLTIEFHQLQP